MLMCSYFFYIVIVLFIQEGQRLLIAEPASDISLEKIMHEDEWIGNQLRKIRWADDNRTWKESATGSISFRTTCIYCTRQLG